MAGCEAAERVLHKADDAVNRDLLDEALEELIVRVDDWKNHKVEQFGRLLLHGVYGVITGKSDQEKDVSFVFTCFSWQSSDDPPSMKSISSSASYFAARKWPRRRTRIRKTGHGRRDPKSRTGPRSCN